MEPKFQKTNGEYIFSIDTEIYRTRTLSFCFDEECGTLLKHGPPDRVRDYANALRTHLVKEGLVDMGSAITVVESDKWELDDINRFVNCSGSIKAWWSSIVQTL
jgi:hypothetical protein